MSQKATGLGPSSFGGQVEWTAQPVSQPAPVVQQPHPAAAQKPTIEPTIAVQAAHRHQAAAIPSGDTSQILGQQANQWRQAASKKGSLLLGLVPTVAKQLAPKQAPESSPLRRTEQQQAQVQPDIAQQGCEAFKPAVQQCIAAAGLPLSKPFYQQALERVMEQQVQQGDGQAKLGTSPDPVAQDAVLADHQGMLQESEQDQPAEMPAGQPSSVKPASMLIDDSDLGMDLVQDEDKSAARQHISESCWPDATISGKPLSTACTAVVQLCHTFRLSHKNIKFASSF